MSSARGTVLVLLAACNSDFPIYDSQSTGAPATTTTGQVPTTTDGESSTTRDDTTSTSSSSSSSSGSSSSEGESTAAPPEQTCRDVLDCVGMCALNFDLACFQQCTENVSPEEGQEAIALGSCIAQGCFTSGKCTPETIMDIACLGCLGLGLLGGSPEGCEEEADACT
jgi:hypothetical protein